MNDTALIERLLAAQSPCDHSHWKEETGDYVATCQLSRDDIPGLLRQVQRWPEILKKEFPEDAEPAEVKKQLLPVTAWRAVAELRAEESIAPLIEVLLATCEVYQGTTDFDDWSFEELPYVFGKIGPPAIERLQNLANDTLALQDARTIALRGLQEIAKAHPAAREPIVALLIEWMEQAADTSIDLNTTVLCALVDLRATEAAEAIERAFSRNVLDHRMMGDWEDVRQELGVASLGLPMPAVPFDSLRETRAQSKELADLLRARALNEAEFAVEDFEDDFEMDDSDASSSAPLQRLEKIGRNDPCSCGSGKKYKKCCGRAF